MTQDQEKIIQQTADHLREKFTGEGTGHDWWHMKRVWDNAKRIGQAEGADMFIVELGALLHDIADWKDHDGDLSVGPRVAGEWLTSIGIDRETIEKIKHIVENVSFKGAGVKNGMASLEGKVVQDADRLDAIGAIAVARTFTWGGSRGRLLYDPDFKAEMHESFEAYKNSTSSSLHHFYEKLFLLKDMMNTATGKKLAEDRDRFMHQFVDQFLAEWDGKR